ncbi:MAG: phage tail protein, partial [Clostridiales bacterium]|nr:phage tail protein [Clostridiales bacterium]
MKKQWKPESVPTPADFNRLENLVPTGAFMWYYGISAPDGWLVCDGSPIVEKDYPELFNHLFNVRKETAGESGSGNEVRLPNLRKTGLFVGGHENQIGELKSAFSNIVVAHTHDVNISHGHDVEPHEHSMQHRHLMYLMRTDETAYDAFPHDTDITVTEDKSKVFGHSSGAYKRQYAFTSKCKDAENSSATDKGETGPSISGVKEYSASHKSEIYGNDGYENYSDIKIGD